MRSYSGLKNSFFHYNFSNAYLMLGFLLQNPYKILLMMKQFFFAVRYTKEFSLIQKKLRSIFNANDYSRKAIQASNWVFQENFSWPWLSTDNATKVDHHDEDYNFFRLRFHRTLCQPRNQQFSKNRGTSRDVLHNESENGYCPLELS